jgi:hypothetical protein
MSDADFGDVSGCAQPQRFFCVSNLEKPVPDPKEPDLPPATPSPEYAPGQTPEEFPSDPPATGDPDDGRPRDLRGMISIGKGDE